LAEIDFSESVHEVKRYLDRDYPGHEITVNEDGSYSIRGPNINLDIIPPAKKVGNLRVE